MKNQGGFTLLEVLLALGLLGIIAAGILGALATSSRATITNDVQTTSQNLAEGQMEYVRSLPYDGSNDPPVYQVLSGVPLGYSVTCDAVRLDPDGDGLDDDDGLQKVVVTVNFGSAEATAIEAYKVK